jgi:hypothetical protein
MEILPNTHTAIAFARQAGSLMFQARVAYLPKHPTLTLVRLNARHEHLLDNYPIWSGMEILHNTHTAIAFARQAGSLMFQARVAYLPKHPTQRPQMQMPK